MFCGKCGNKEPDEALFCSACGNKLKEAEQAAPVTPAESAVQTAPEVPVAQEVPGTQEIPVAPEVPMAQEAIVAQTNTVAPESAYQETAAFDPMFTAPIPEVPKKRGIFKKVAAAVLCVALVVATVGGVAWWQFRSEIKIFITSKSEYLVALETSEAGSLLETLVKGFPKKGEGSFKISADLGSLMGALVSGGDMSVGADFKYDADKMYIDADCEIEADGESISATLKCDGETMLASADVGGEKQSVYFDIPDAMKTTKGKPAFEITQAEKNHIRKQYVTKAICGAISEDDMTYERSSEFDGIKARKLEAVITNKTVEKMLQNVADEVKDDEVIQGILDRYLDYMKDTVGSSAITGMDEATTEAIAEAVELAAKQIAKAGEFSATYTQYFDGNEKVLRRECVISAQGEELSIVLDNREGLQALVVKNGDETVFDFENKYTLKSGKYTGSMICTVSGEKVFEAGYTDLEKVKDLTHLPAGEFEASVYQNGKKFTTVKLDTEKSGNTYKSEIGITVDSKTYTIKLETSLKKATSVSKPKIDKTGAQDMGDLFKGLLGRSSILPEIDGESDSSDILGGLDGFDFGSSDTDVSGYDFGDYDFGEYDSEDGSSSGDGVTGYDGDYDYGF